MRNAVLVLGLIFGVIVLAQSVIVGIGGLAFNDVALSYGGLMGRIVALFFGVGAAFVLVKAMVSLSIFGVGGLLGVGGGIYFGYSDLILWGVLSLVLAVLSYFAARAEIEERPTIPATPDEEIRPASQI